MFGNEQWEKKPPEYMSKGELDRCYLPENWANYSFFERLSILQETESRFAAAQHRPAKELKPEFFNDSTLGYWSSSRNYISINSSLLSDGVIETGAGRIKRADAPFLLYNTVAHEGYHAYQSYAIENPNLHKDLKQLEEWRLNNEAALTDRGYERNYIKDGNLYRIQPLERDAIKFAEQATQETFDTIQQKTGIIPEYEYDYKDMAEACSYEKALRSEMAHDRKCVEHMMEKMRENHRIWNHETAGESADSHGETSVQENGLQHNTLTYEQAKSLENPYANDEGHYEQQLVKSLSGSSTRYVPALADQYADRVCQINDAHPYRNINPNDMGQYMEEIYQAQEELGYFPEFDARAQESYDAYMEQFDRHFSERNENGNDKEKEFIAENREQFDKYYREQTGYFPNRPELHVEEQFSQSNEDSVSQRENAEISMDNYVAESKSSGVETSQNSEKAFSQGESSDISMDSYASGGHESGGESYDSGYDMSSYSGISDSSGNSSNLSNSKESESEGKSKSESISY